MPDHNPTDFFTRRSGALLGVPATLNRDAGTVEATVAAGAIVPRKAPAPDGSWTAWNEELDLASAKLSPPIGAPLLLDHENRVDALVGTAGGLKLDRNGALVATLRFHTGPRSREAMEKTADGTLTGVSVGYRAQWERNGEKDGKPTFIARNVEIFEISLTPIPADPAARIRSGSTSTQGSFKMPDHNMPPDAGEQAALSERSRITEIRKFTELASRTVITPEQATDFETRAIAEGITVDVLRTRVMDHALAQPQPRAPAPRPIQMFTSYDAPDAIRSRMSEALVSRVTGKEPSDAARQYRGLTIAGMAAELLVAGGERMGRNTSPAEIITRAMTTSDFPILLKDSAARTLQQRMEAAPGAARMICAPRTVPDFRPGKFLQFAGARDLSLLNEGGEIQQSPPAERAETYQAQTWARGMMFSRQALVNDDLGALEQVMLFANAVTATEAQEFAKMFATNGAGWGPTLSDGLPLFHATHNNVSAGVCGTAGISAGRIVMRAQTDANGNLVAPEPRLMLVGPTNETAAEQALVAIQVVATSEANRPVFASRMTHAVEPRLAGAPWFLFADPTIQPVLAMVTLEGTGGLPQISEHIPSNRDGIEFKLVHDFTIAPMSFVGAVRLTGA